MESFSKHFELGFSWHCSMPQNSTPLEFTRSLRHTPLLTAGKIQFNEMQPSAKKPVKWFNERVEGIERG